MSVQFRYEQKWFNTTDAAFEDSSAFLDEFGQEGYELDKLIIENEMLLYIMKKAIYSSLELSVSEQKEFDSHDRMGEVY